MKRRTVTTYKILAVAAAAVAGSTVAVGMEARSRPAQTPVNNGAPLDRSRALPQTPGTYRPLHDGDGYPLVGNLIRKGNEPPRDAGSDGAPPTS